MIDAADNSADGSRSLPELFMDDLHVGRRFVSAETYTLTEDAIIAFAREFDDQPFHTDPAAAASTLFKGLAGSGWMVLAITMRLINSSLRLASGNVGVRGEVAWPNPSRPGQVLRAVSTVTAVEPSTTNPSRGRVTLRTETIDQSGLVVAVLTGTLLTVARPLP